MLIQPAATSIINQTPDGSSAEAPLFHLTMISNEVTESQLPMANLSPAPKARCAQGDHKDDWAGMPKKPGYYYYYY